MKYSVLVGMVLAFGFLGCADPESDPEGLSEVNEDLTFKLPFDVHGDFHLGTDSYTTQSDLQFTLQREGDNTFRAYFSNRIRTLRGSYTLTLKCEGEDDVVYEGEFDVGRGETEAKSLYCSNFAEYAKLDGFGTWSKWEKVEIPPIDFPDCNPGPGC